MYIDGTKHQCLTDSFHLSGTDLHIGGVIQRVLYEGWGFFQMTIGYPPKPIGSMGLVYTPTFTKQINHSWIGKYTVRPNGSVMGKSFYSVRSNYRKFFVLSVVPQFWRWFLSSRLRSV